MPNICSKTHIQSNDVDTLVKEFNFLRKQICAALQNSGGSLPSQVGHAGEFLTTNGTTASWATTGGSSLFPTTGTGTATGNVNGVLGTNTLLISADDGATEITNYHQTSSNIDLLWSNNAETAINFFRINSNGALISLSSGKTFVYATDVSANYTDRSLVDKEFALNLGGNNSRIGAIITHDWTTPIAGNFSPSGITPSVSGGGTQINGTTTLSSNINTGVENWSISFFAAVNLKDGSDIQIGAGINQSVNLGNVSKLFRFILTSGTGYINFYDNPAITPIVATNLNQFKFNWIVGDTLRFTVSQREQYLTATMYNATNGESSSLTVDNYYSTGTVGKVQIYSKGNFTFTGNLLYSLNEYSNPTVVVVGDSIGAGAITDKPVRRWVNVAMDGITSKFIDGSGGYETSATALDRVSELVNTIIPNYVLYACGVNDVLNSVTANAFEANVTSFVNSMMGAGVIPILVSLTPQAIDVDPYNTKLQNIATANSLIYINITTALREGSGGITGNTIYYDSAGTVHPNNTGHALIGRLVHERLLPVIPAVPGLKLTKGSIASIPAYLIGKDVNDNVVFVPGGGFADNYILNNPLLRPDGYQAPAQAASINILGDIVALGNLTNKLMVGGTLANPLFSYNRDGDNYTRATLFSTGNFQTIPGGGTNFNGGGAGYTTLTFSHYWLPNGQAFRIDRYNGSGNILELAYTGSATLAAVDIEGSSVFKGATYSYVGKSANYTVTSSDYTVDCTSGTFTITLPTAVGVTGKIYNVKNSGTGIITLATTSSQTIDGATTQTLAVQYQSFYVQSNGSNWIIL